VIQLTHFNGSRFYLNPEVIRTVEATPDTVITLINDQKILVNDKTEEVVKKVIQYKRLILNPNLDINLGE
jgi:flagellar protein FlbD